MYKRKNTADIGNTVSFSIIRVFPDDVIYDVIIFNTISELCILSSILIQQYVSLFVCVRKRIPVYTAVCHLFP